MAEFRKITLGNGLRVVLAPVAGTAAVTAMTFHAAGSRHEPADLSGVSHFLEHLCFKGTPSRPTTMHLARELDAVGAEYNAYTDRDHTSFYIRLQAERSALALELLSEMVFRSLCRPEDIRAEAGVIAEELRMYEDNPIMAVEENMQAELFAGSSLGRPVGGTTASVAGLGQADILGYRRRHYRPERTVLAVAGSFDEVETVGEIRRRFGRLRPSGPAARAFRPFRLAPSRRAPRCRVISRETEQVQMALGFPGYPLGHRLMPAMSVMANILGGTMSSRLFLSVRERHGLAYHVSASGHGFQDVGQLSIQAGLSRDGFDRALRLIVSECRRLKDSLVSREEIRRAQENIRGRITLGLEDSRSVAAWGGRQELLQGRILGPEERLRQIEAVTREAVRQAAREVFRADRAALAAIGTFGKGTDLTRHFRNL